MSILQRTTISQSRHKYDLKLYSKMKKSSTKLTLFPIKKKYIFFSYTYLRDARCSNSDTGSTRWLNVNAVFVSLPAALPVCCISGFVMTRRCRYPTHILNEQGLPAKGIRQANVTTAPARANGYKIKKKNKGTLAAPPIVLCEQSFQP